MKQPIDLVLIGAGQRGALAYGSYALARPEDARIVAVAEPDPERRKRVADQHDIDDDMCFADWRELTSRSQLARGAIIATQDQDHVPPAVAAMQAGYDVLLEKPMAHTLAGCVQLVQTAEHTGRILQVCHVLRYSPFWRALHEVLESGRLGDIITVEHRENVAFWHMAHSFVRGNWRNAALSSPMILAKCCHDLDILVWNLSSPVQRLSSFGSLRHFRSENAGPEIPDRCTDGCPVEQSCPFSAIGVYLDFRILPPETARQSEKDMAAGNPPSWPLSVLSAENTHAARLAELQSGPYGRCVYRCDNDVVDHQTVSMELENGTSVVLVMHGHSNEEHRSMRYDGTRATLRARFGHHSEITIHDHGTNHIEQIPLDPSTSGHGGGDHGIMADFIRAVRGEIAPLTSARTSLESHLLAFAAEEARTHGTIVDMPAFRTRADEVTQAQF